MPAKRGWRALPFHTAWELFWTCGGLAAFYRLVAHPDLWSLAIFCLALLCGLRIIGALAWMTSGEEVIRLAPGRLEIGYRLLELERIRSYPLGDIGTLQTWDDNPASDPGVPFPRPMSHGAIKFETPVRDIFCAAALDEADAARVVAYLRRRWLAAARG